MVERCYSDVLVMFSFCITHVLVISKNILGMLYGCLLLFREDSGDVSEMFGYYFNILYVFKVNKYF